MYKGQFLPKIPFTGRSWSKDKENKKDLNVR